ncbi:MAG: hypothetical protein J0H25_03240 [Rhizobiales bacterium]|nr:hypothetical protein [Hyphomicrobiales bacterium]
MSDHPTPSDFFGRAPLADDVVIRWAEMLGYYERLASADPLLSVEEIGRDWSGRPLVALSIGGGQPAPGRRAIAITAGIHANELGGSQMMPDLVRELLTTRR